jgi:hypothetical protein
MRFARVTKCFAKDIEPLLDTDDNAFFKEVGDLIPWARVSFEAVQKHLVIKLLLSYSLSEYLNHDNLVKSLFQTFYSAGEGTPSPAI